MKMATCFLGYPAFLALTTLLLLNMAAAREKPQMVGGPCLYTEYSGTAKIISVDEIAGSQAAPGQKVSVYQVRFIFEPVGPIPEPFLDMRERPHELTLINGFQPRLGFLKKYGIEPDKTFPCNLKVIKKGTCTPVLFDFPTIDRTDYKANQ